MDLGPGAQIHAGQGLAGHPGQDDQSGGGRLASPGPDRTPSQTPDRGDNLHILSPFIIYNRMRKQLSQGKCFPKGTGEGVAD